MATFLIDPEEALLEVTAALAAQYATYEVRLLKAGIAFSPVPTLAALAAIECDFSGYALVAGAAPPVPYPDLPRGGISYTSPNARFTVGASPTVFNNVYGFFVCTPNPTPTQVILTSLFNNFVPMGAAGDQVNLQFSLNYFGDQGLLVTVNGNLV